MTGNLGLCTIRRRLFTATVTQRLTWRYERLLVASPQRILLATRPACTLQGYRYYHRSVVRWEGEKEAAVEPSEASVETTEAPPEAPEPPPSGDPPTYSTPELAADAAKHKAGMEDPDLPFYQNPLHHNNPEMEKIYREDFASEEEFQAAVQPQPPLDVGDGRPPAPEYLHALADEIVQLSMLEMNELVNKIAEHYGFHEGMLSPDADGAAEDDEEEEEAPKEEAKTSFDIKLMEFDAKAKIKVIKEVRALAGLGLKEAKELVESAPKVIYQGVKKEEAEEIKAKLEELGAKIEIV